MILIRLEYLNFLKVQQKLRKVENKIFLDATTHIKFAIFSSIYVAMIDNRELTVKEMNRL